MPAAKDPFERLVREERDLQDLEFTDLRVDDLDLSGMTFTNCQFQGAVFTQVNLEEAHFRQCHLGGVRFSSCAMARVSFENSRFTGDAAGTFRFCKLREARFQDCDCSLLLFDRCSLYGAHLCDNRMSGVQFQESDFSEPFGRSRRSAVTLTGNNLEFGKLRGLEWADSKLLRNRFTEADLSNCDFSGSDCRGCDFSNADLHHADFSRSDLREAILTGFHLNHLAAYRGMRVSANQQHALLAPLGIDVE